MNIALFASGKGTNVENILSCFSDNKKVNILFIATNNLKSGAINHAKSYNIPLLTFKKLGVTTFFVFQIVLHLNLSIPIHDESIPLPV